VFLPRPLKCQIKSNEITPIVLFLLILAAVLIFAKGSALAPFIYSLF
jgi:hypothetical protein